MDSRMSKYKDDEAGFSRVSRNEDLYKEINKSEIDSFDVGSNATVIGHNENEIDIEKIKRILDKRYNETPKRRSIRIDQPEEKEEKTEDVTTKEYDLNVILEKAKDDKEETYEEARSKKLRDTQFDILKNLQVDGNEKKEEKKDNVQEDLMELINTISINEAKKKENVKEVAEEDSAAEDSTPLDLFEDLKGSDDTEVFEGIKEEIERIEKTSKILSNEKKEEKEVTNNKANTIDKSFYTTKNLFSKRDFDKDDFLEEDKVGIGVKILIFLVVVVFLVGLYVFLKSIIGF